MRLAPLRSFSDGGRRTLIPPNLDLPAERVHHALIRPLIRAFHKTFAQRVFTNIIPFLRITLLPSQPVMKRMRLPAAIRIVMQPPELTLPERHPFLQRKSQIIRRAEQMQMVGHEQIITHQPCVGRLPCRAKMFLHGGVRKPQFPSFRTNRQKDNRRLSLINIDPARRTMASDIGVRSVAHRPKLPETFSRVSKKSKPRFDSNGSIPTCFPPRKGETLSSRHFFPGNRVSARQSLALPLPSQQRLWITSASQLGENEENSIRC